MSDSNFESTDQTSRDPRRLAIAKRAGQAVVGAGLAASVVVMGAQTVENFRDMPGPSDPTSYTEIKNDLLNGDHPNQEVPNTIRDEEGHLVQLR
jgi:hypothetical protein